jgi:hypothetical protein
MTGREPLDRGERTAPHGPFLLGEPGVFRRGQRDIARGGRFTLTARFWTTGKHAHAHRSPPPSPPRARILSGQWVEEQPRSHGADELLRGDGRPDERIASSWRAKAREAVGGRNLVEGSRPRPGYRSEQRPLGHCRRSRKRTLNRNDGSIEVRVREGGLDP